jgi:hypothetical protein
MANRKVTITIDTKANTSGATQAATAMDRLATSSNAATTATTNVAKGASKASQLVGQAGYQVQDFAVQVGGGTSALTAFSQQAPQLLGAFGPAGAIAGAFVAIGAIATKVFLGMQVDAMSAADKTKLLAEGLKEAGEAAAKAVDRKYDFGRQKIEDAATEAQRFAEQLNNTAENQLKLNQSVSDSFNALYDAEKILMEMRGESTDAFKSQSEQAAEDARRRKEEVNQAIAAEQLKIKLAEDAVTIASETVVKGQELKQNAFEEMRAAREALRVTEARLEATKKLASQTSMMSKIGGMLSETGSLSPEQAKRSEAAQFTLDTGQIEREMEALRGKIESLSELMGKSTADINKSWRELNDVEANLQATKENVQTAVTTITQAASDEEIGAAAKQIEERAKLIASEIKNITDEVKASTPKEQEALETIKKNLEDGKITLNEISTTSSAISQLGPQIREAITGNTQKITQLTTIMQEFKSQNAALQNQIDNLQRRISTPSPQR